MSFYPIFMENYCSSHLRNRLVFQKITLSQFVESRSTIDQPNRFFIGRLHHKFVFFKPVAIDWLNVHQSRSESVQDSLRVYLWHQTIFIHPLLNPTSIDRLSTASLSNRPSVSSLSKITRYLIIVCFFRSLLVFLYFHNLFQLFVIFSIP